MPPDGYPAFLQYLQSGRVSAFLPDRAADDTMIFVAEFEAATDGRSFSVRRVEGSVDSELQELLCRTAVLRIGDLLKSFLSGYFYIAQFEICRRRAA